MTRLELCNFERARPCEVMAALAASESKGLGDLSRPPARKKVCGTVLLAAAHGACARAHLYLGLLHPTAV